MTLKMTSEPGSMRLTIGMNPKPVEQARTRELALALPALRRARQRAAEIAIATSTCLVQMKDGRVVEITPDELRASAAKASSSK